MTYLQGLTHQVTALDNVLGRSRAQLALIPSKELEFTRRQREAQGLERVVTQLQSRLKEAEIAEAVEDPSVRLVDAAVLPRAPSSPNRVLNVVLALVFGLWAGTAGAFLREYIDRTARSREDVRVATGVPVLGLLPFARSRALRARRTSAPEPQLRRQAASGGPSAVRASYSLFPVPREAEPPSGQQSDEPSVGQTRHSESEPVEPRRPRAPARRPGRAPGGMSRRCSSVRARSSFRAGRGTTSSPRTLLSRAGVDPRRSSSSPVRSRPRARQPLR